MILINSSSKNALKIFQPFLPIFVPVGIGFLMSALQEKGIESFFIDEQIENDVEKKIDEFVKRMEPPYIFGFSVLTAAFKSSLELSKKVKELYPDSIVIFGGIHPSAAPEEVLQYEQVDIVVRGEGEFVLPELYFALKEMRDFSNLESISYRNGSEIVHNERAPIITDLDKIPPFPYQLFADKKGYDLGFIMSSRGCPYKCIFCSNRVTTDKGYRYRSAESVIEELEQLYYKYNQRYVLFLDDNFLVNKNRIYTLTKEIKARGLHEKMTFNFQARGDNVDEDLLRELYSAGFRSIFFGIETASEEILKIIKKGETLEEIVSAVKLAKDIGYHVSATFINALPTETHEDRMNAVDLSHELDLDMVRFNNATPYPGTELFEMAQKEGELKIQGCYENFNSVSTFIENPFNKIPFSYVPKGETEDEIRKDILFSYLSFYFNFKRLKKIFTRPDQGVGWFKAGSKILDFLKKIPAFFVLFLMLSFKYAELFFSVIFQYKTAIKRKEFWGIFKNFFRGRKEK